MCVRPFAFLALAAGSLVVALPPTASAQFDDPLPKGAKVRLGTTRMRDINAWAGAGLLPDGTRLLAFSVNGVTRIDIASGKPVGKATRLPATGIGTRAALSADGKRAASSNFAGAIVWDTSSGATIAKIDRRVSYAEWSDALSADGKTLAVGGAKDDRAKDKPVTAGVWDVDTQTQRCEVAVLQNQSANVALSGDGKVLATWGVHSEPNPAGNRPDPAKDFGRIVQFWDAGSGKSLSRTQLDGFGQPVVALTSDGKLAALASGLGTVRLVEPFTGAVQRQLFGRAGMGLRVAFSPDGKLVAAAAADGSVQVWQTVDGKRVAAVECPIGLLSANIRELRFTSNERAVVFAVVGSTALVWEVPSGKLLTPAGGHLGQVSAVTFAADGKEILTGGQDGALLRWNATTGKALGEIVLRPGGSPQPVRLGSASVAFAPGGRIAIVDRSTRVAYDLDTGAPLFAIPNGYEARALLASDGRTLVAAPTLPFGQEPPQTIALTVWDIATGTRLATLELPAGELLAADVSPDRKRLLTALGTRPGKDGKSELLLTGWSLDAGGKKLGQLGVPGGFGTTLLAPAPDNATALVGTPNGKLIVFDIALGQSLREIDTQRQAVTAVPVFAPDGKSFAVGLGGNFTSSLGSVRIYESENGKLLRTFPGHLGSVTCLAYSPDGQMLASGSADTTVLLWQLN